MKHIQKLVVQAMFLGVGILVVFGLARGVWDLWMKRMIALERQNELLAVEKEHQNLLDRLTEATGSAFIEKIAREKLGLVKPGETVLIMPKAEERRINGKPDSDEQLVPNWKQWLRLFF